MRKNFNSVQTLKSSEDCEKFSKSVSYETLVGGTTTTGRGIKQTRRVFLSSADKPLSAVGTLISLLCNSAKVMEKLLRHVITRRTLVRRGYLPEKCTHANEESLFASVTWLMRLPRRIQRMLLRMTIPALAFLLSLNLSTAFAEDSCECLRGGADGKTLTISTCPNGKLSSSSCDGQKTANNVIIGTGVTSIGDSAFSFSSSLTSITIPDSVTSIGDAAFAYASSLTSITIPDSVTSIGNNAFQSTGLTSITIPDSVTSIGGCAFCGASSLKSIIIPDNINTEKWNAWGFMDLPENTDIVCQGDLKTCYEKLAKYIPESKGGDCKSNCIKKDIQPAQSSQCNGSYIYENGNCHKRNEEQCNATGKYYYNGATCLYRPRNRQVTCVNPNYKANDGYCDRLRYTPAEAAEVLRDDNTNSVTITFKQ